MEKWYFDGVKGEDDSSEKLLLENETWNRREKNRKNLKNEEKYEKSIEKMMLL